MSDGHAARITEIEKRIDRQISGAIALSGAGGALSIAPQNMAEMFEFAKMMAVSGPCVRPAFRGSPGACLAIALQAFRTGADPFAVANKAYITTNRATGDEQISYEAQYILAVLNTSGKLAKRLRPTYSGEGHSRKCKIIGYIVGEDEPLEYESPAVGEIQVKNSPLWKGDPDQQLFYYSSRAWGRRHLPEVLLGMYTPEEIRGEIIDMTPAPSPPQREQFREAIKPDEERKEREPEDEPIDEVIFEVVDLDGVVHEHSVAATACQALVDIIDEAKVRGREAVEGIWESNAGTIKEISEALEDGVEPLQQAYADALETFEAKTENGEEVRQNFDVEPSGQSEQHRRDTRPADNATGLVKKEAGADSTVVEAPRSLWVLPREGARKGTTDWAGTAEDMIAAIGKLADPADTEPNGRFKQDNRRTLDMMRISDKKAWSTVEYRLGDRYRQLRGSGS